jgi:integrase
MGRIFTDTWLRSLERHPPAKRKDYTEKGRKGLMLRHWPGGERTFVVRYHRDGAQQIITLGNYPSVSLDGAHDEHTQIRRMLTQGLDPQTERARVARQRESESQKRAASDAITVRNVIAEWGWHYARRRRRRPREAVRLLRTYTEAWEGRPIREIAKRDVVMLLDKVVARGSAVMANRIDALGKQAFSFAMERDLIDANPWTGISRPGGEERARQRKLSEQELRVLWLALDDSKTTASQHVRLALKLILVTAQRPGEVAGARWDEVEGDLWTIPAARLKSGDRIGRSHQVPLSDLALELMEMLRPLAKGRPHVFPSAHAKRKREEPMLELALSRALRNNRADDGTIFGLAWFTPHDLRRTAASMMTALGVQRLHVSKVLNHADRDITGRVYDLNDYGPEKRQALQLWADHLRAIVTGKAPKVVPIGKERRA